jgi:hypothetical protein
MGIWIDAFEVDASLSRQHKKKSSKMQLNAWQPKASLLKEGRYTSLVALQAVDVAGSVADVYSQCAHGLRSGGRLFAADLMLSEQADDEALECIESATAGKAPLVSAEEHGRALKGAGLHLENTFDLTGSLIASIKSGIRDSVSAIEALREFPQPVKKGVSPI